MAVSVCPALAEPGTWDHYKTRFISQDGRVIDIYQNRISHSEGQGYGLLLSVQNNDQPTFDHILSWTRNNLMVRKDSLSAWSWGQLPSGEWNVIDYNNATDGDLLMSWALILAGERWGRPDLNTSGLTLADVIRSRLVVRWQNQMVLLPGYFGFTTRDTLTINPSYFIFPAFDQLAKGDASGFWTDLSGQCTVLTERASQGRLQLPPDWAILNAGGDISIDTRKSRYFGYDAVRIPLYLAMAGLTTHLKTFTAYLSLFHQMGYLPRRVDLVDNMVSLDDAPAGFYAVFARCAQLTGDGKTGQTLMDMADRKIKEEPDDYYSNTLYLLALAVGTP
jgi:endoglucanase